jgi:hypothetical protein
MAHEADTLSTTMRGALEVAACDAGLWRHRDRAGYYVPGLGTVPFNRRTINALETRGLVRVSEAPIDHEVVYGDVVLRPGTIVQRITVTREGQAALGTTRSRKAHSPVSREPA